MASAEAEDERRARSSRRSRLPSLLYGTALLALGACLGVVIGSLTETPRLLLERLRGPVETVDVAAPEGGPSEEAGSPAVLERFGELQEGVAPRRAAPAARRGAKPPAPAPAEPAPERIAPERVAESAAPSAPAVSSGRTEPVGEPAPPAARAPATEPAARAPAAAEGGAPQAVVQVASYVDKKPADDLAAKLREIGFDSYVSQPAAENGRFRVRIRPGAGETAAALATRLEGFGFDTWATSE